MNEELAYEEFEENEVEERVELRKLMKLPPLIILCNGR